MGDRGVKTGSAAITLIAPLPLWFTWVCRFADSIGAAMAASLCAVTTPKTGDLLQVRDVCGRGASYRNIFHAVCALLVRLARLIHGIDSQGVLSTYYFLIYLI